MKYSEKLKDPRWQRRRLEIMNRDDWACRTCGNKEKELHVHHLRYQGDPWDAPNDALLTLCKSCHESEHLPPPAPPEPEKEWWEVAIESNEAILIRDQFIRWDPDVEPTNIIGTNLYVGYFGMNRPDGWYLWIGNPWCDENSEKIFDGVWESAEAMQLIEKYIENSKLWNHLPTGELFVGVES